MIPHLGQFIVEDSRPLHKDEHYHDLAIAREEGEGGSDALGGGFAGYGSELAVTTRLQESKTIL